LERYRRPEPVRCLQEADGRPITRFVFGIKYASSLACGAGKVGRELDGVREPEDVPRVHISDGDAGAAREDPYAHGHILAGSLRHETKVTVITEGSLDLQPLTFGGAALSATATMGGGGRRSPTV
jgi:hypothetical protein